MTKKIIILITIILIISIIIFLAWQGFVNKKSFKTDILNKENAKNEFSIKEKNDILKNEKTKSEETFIKKITENIEVFDFWFYQNQLFYLTKKGEVYKIENNEIKKLPYSFENKMPIKIFENKEKILGAFNNPLEPEWFIFDNLDLAWRPLPNILEANWLNNKEIIAIDKSERLIKINENFEITVIANNFNFIDFYIYPLNSEEIVLMEKPSGELENKIFIFNLKNLTIRLLEKIAKDILIKPINENLNLRYSLNKNLIIDFKDKNEKIALNTFIEKCAYNLENNETTFYCFLPQKLISFNEYYQMKDKTIDDTLLKITFGNNTIEQKTYSFHLNNDQLFDVKNVKYLNNKIYFINNYDDSIYEIDTNKFLTPSYEIFSDSSDEDF